MTCTHIGQARKKLATLVGNLKDFGNTSIYEKSGPYIKPGSVEAYVNDKFFTYDYGAKWSTIEPSVISSGKVEEKINEIENILNSCSCYANEKVQREGETSRKNDLINAHREERENIQSQIDGIKSEYRNIVDKQHSLIETERNQTALVRTENSQLQRALGLSEGQVKQLEIQLADKTSELSQNKQALDRLRQAFLDLSISNATNAERARAVSEHLDWTKGRLVISDNRIVTMENKLDQKQQRLEATQETLTNLRIRYGREIGDKDNELRNKEREVRNLRSQAGQSREELLEERLHLKEEKLELLAEQLRVNLQQTNNLIRHYERLINAQREHNQTNITTHENNITRIKQEILNRGGNMRNAQKLCRKCEKVAKLRIELNQLRQQQQPEFEARQQQVPPRRGY